MTQTVAQVSDGDRQLPPQPDLQPDRITQVANALSHAYAEMAANALAEGKAEAAAFYADWYKTLNRVATGEHIETTELPPVHRPA